jgi:zinc D-Ala-D-Ala carboxypeptidase
MNNQGCKVRPQVSEPVPKFALALFCFSCFVIVGFCNLGCGAETTKSQGMIASGEVRGEKFAEGAQKTREAQAESSKPNVNPASFSETEPARISADSGKTYSNDELLGRFEPSTHSDFMSIKAPYTKKDGMRMRSEAGYAFIAMWKHAKKDGITLDIISSTRNFEHQSGIWNRKWKALGAKKGMSAAEKAVHIMRFSAMPGCSRHHWGTDIDLNSLENGHFEAGGVGAATYQWLVKHASDYGFCQVYSARSTGRATGYEEEKWHWSYLPIAQPMLTAFLEQISYADIIGFEGSEKAKEIAVIKNYVSGISEACQ